MSTAISETTAGAADAALVPLARQHAAAIREVIAAHARLAVDIALLEDEADLYEAGLTSLTTVNLMLALENRFDVEFTDAMLGRRTFSSIAALSEAIDQLLQR